MNEELLIALGRTTMEFALQREQLIKTIQELQKQLAEAKKPPEG